MYGWGGGAILSGFSKIKFWGRELSPNSITLNFFWRGNYKYDGEWTISCINIILGKHCALLARVNPLLPSDKVQELKFGITNLKDCTKESVLYSSLLCSSALAKTITVYAIFMRGDKYSDDNSLNRFVPVKLPVIKDGENYKISLVMQEDEISATCELLETEEETHHPLLDLRNKV